MGIFLFVMAICMSAAAFCVFAWAVKDGQFKENDEIGNSPINSEEKYS